MSEQSWLYKLTHFLSREPHSQSQLIDVLRDAEERHLLDQDALQMIEGVLAVSDKKVRDVMIPRPQMVVVKGDETPKEALPLMIQSQHSRFPVVSENPDVIIGILLAKDLLAVLLEDKTTHAFVRDFIRPALFIPESKRLDVLLKEFRQNRNHMAIVVDEYGTTSGLITIEDVLEEIVGDIADEYDIEESHGYIQSINETRYLVNALTPIKIFNSHFYTTLSDEDFDTIGGLVLQQFGRLPKRNEKTRLEDFEVTVIKASRRGIQLLEFSKKADGN